MTKPERPGQDDDPVRAQKAPRRRPLVVIAMNYAPELVGAARYTTDIAEHFAGNGYDVTVISTPPHYPHWRVGAFTGADGTSWRNCYSAGMCGDVRVLRCPVLTRTPMRGLWRALAPLSFAVTAAPVILWTIWRRRPGAVVCVEPTLLAAPIGLLAAWLVRARTILHVQDLELHAAHAMAATANDRAGATGGDKGGGGAPGGFRRSSGERTRARLASSLASILAGAQRVISNRFDAVIAISTGMAAELARAGVRPDRTTIIRNWVNVRALRAAADQAAVARMRATLGGEPGAHLALYAGALNAKHDLASVIDAARLLSSSPLQLVVAIVGDGPTKAGLMAAAAGLGNVRFHPLAPAADLPALLAAADVHVLPHDPRMAGLAFPSKLGGMLASGRPIIATASPGSDLGRYLGGMATLCPPGDANALAAAVLSTLNDAGASSARARLRGALRLDRRRALARFSAVITGREDAMHSNTGGAASECLIQPR